MAAIVAVFAAAAQLGGRLLVPHLASLEAPLNDWLTPRRISLRGLSGSWQGFNPTVTVASVTFPGGQLNDMTLELDVGESLWRNHIVARRLEIGAGRLRFVETPSGWRLEGSGEELGMDVAASFRHSDAVRIHARIELVGARATGALDAQAIGANRDGRNRWRVQLQPVGCRDCALSAHFDVKAGSGAHDLAGAALIDAEGFTVDAALAAATGLPQMALDMALRWHGDGREARAAASVTAMNVELPGGATKLAATARASGREGFYRGVVNLDGSVGKTSLSAGLKLAGNVDGALTLMADALDLGAWNAFLTAALGPRGTVGRWFHGIAAAGRLRDVQLHVDAEGVAYAGELDGVSTSSYGGVPKLQRAYGSLRGHARAMRIDFESADAFAALPDHFDRTWPYDRVAGTATLWFDPSYFGLRVRFALRHRDADADAAIALTRPKDALEGRLAVFARVDRAPALEAMRYVPKKLPGNLKPWLESSIVGGRLDVAEVVYHGHTRTLPDLPMRRLALDARVADGTLVYHPDWPAAERLRGRLKVSGAALHASALSGVAFGAAFADATVDVPAGAKHANVRGSTQVDAQRALDFARATPAGALMPWLCDCWRAAGAVDVSASLRVPLGGVTLGEPPRAAAATFKPAAWRPTGNGLEGTEVDLRFNLLGATLDFADLGLRFERMRGEARFVSPHALTAAGLRGELFDAPVTVKATAAADAVVLDVQGRSRMTDVYAVLGMQELPLGTGAFDFAAQLTVPATQRAATLALSSDGVGLALHLPAPLGKAAAARRALRAQLVFSDDYVRTEFMEGGVSGWLHVDDGVVLAGALGLGTAPPAVAFAGGVAVTGKLGPVDLAGVAGLTSAPPLRLDDLSMESAQLGDLRLQALRLDGLLAADAVDLRLRSDEVDGVLRRTAQDPWQLRLAAVRMPAGQSNVDPLDASLIGRVPAADVVVEHVLVGGDDFGRWRFGVRPTKDALRITGLTGDIKGLSIKAEEDVIWRRDADASFFRGTVTAGNLADVLPQWGYDASVESAGARIEGFANWPGSPLNFELDDLSGDLGVTVTDGRFVDVEGASAGRFFALLNFSRLARRLQFDFSDVFGKGIVFDAISARAAFDDGLLRFREPMEIRGTMSAFKIYGTVDFADGSLDNDMIVTLPLSTGLPWYAIWIASTNPATAAGVLLGQQVFKNQLAALSSARYRITGVIENPEPKFIGIFTGDLDAARDGDDGADGADGANE